MEAPVKETSKKQGSLDEEYPIKVPLKWRIMEKMNLWVNINWCWLIVN